MDPLRTQYFLKKLETLKSELEVAAETNTEDSEVVSLEQSIGRIARMEAIYAQQTAMELKQRQKDRIKAIEQAIKKVIQGRYGICARCKKPIAEERLEIQPEAVVCVRCAEAR